MNDSFGILKLKQNENICLVTYIWIDGTGEELRSKTKTLRFIPKTVADVPKWQFGGCGTYQSETNNSDMHIFPVAICKDPFFRGNNKLVMCDTYTCERKPSVNNKRYSCQQVLSKVISEEPWFSVEQEYTVYDRKGKILKWPKLDTDANISNDPYLCCDENKIYRKQIIESFYNACLYAGLKIEGIEPCQWKFKIGPCQGISIADQLWIARYIFHRMSEDFDIVVTFNPKPVPDVWKDLRLHIHFSTKEMRQPAGLTIIKEAVERLFHQNVSIKKEAIEIPYQVEAEGFGCLVDKRHLSNCDPYVVIEMILRTVCLEN